MSSNPYFENEQKYLRELAREVAIEKPHLVDLLSSPLQDPDGARLMEGVAYLSGNLREQLDRQFSELTSSLVNMLWPAYARPFPSMTIVEYQVDTHVLDQASKVSAGHPFVARPLYVQGDNPNSDSLHQCRFSQCRDLWLLPAKISQVQQQTASIEITFQLDKPRVLAEIGLDKLRIHLNGATYTTNQLFYLLSHKIKNVTLLAEHHRLPLDNFAAIPVGFKKEDALLPYPKNSYDGYRILQEYFCFPEAFMFMDFKGLDDLPLALNTDSFKLVINFDCEIPDAVMIRDDSIKLNCVPIANLFTIDSEAIDLTGKNDDYVLSASYRTPLCYDIFSVNQVQGLRYPQNGTPYAVNYTAFESFHHQSHNLKNKNHGYYRLKINHAKEDIGYSHTMSFVRDSETKLQNCEETVSVSLNCTNRNVASRLSTHAISLDKACVPDGVVSASNLFKPSMPLYPLLGQTLYWSELTNLSLNYQSLLNLTSLKQILQLYDLPAVFHRQTARQSQQCLDALIGLQTTPIEHSYRGLPVRGLKTTLTVRQSAFLSEGSLYLFCTVIAQFFALYTSVNMFHELEVFNIDNKETYRWPAQINQQTLR
ncbi:type VI secretion system baseplate subunit TssF [Providencia rettgeri]|nr:type VI secretion system baseplate subunit TssF [Providencia rettgeri]